MKYKFTKKQLYGYSIMNWKLYKRGLIDADKRYCSFCYDCYSSCSKCKIARDICGSFSRGDITTYREILTIRIMFFDKINLIIRQLTNEYNEIKEND